MKKSNNIKSDPDNNNIQPGDLIICLTNQETIRFCSKYIGRMGIFLRHGERVSNHDSAFALIDGKCKYIKLINWDRVLDISHKK